MSVVFDFNASFSDAAPVPPILLPVDLMRMEKSGLFMDAIFVMFLLSSPPRSSFMSVVFDFNASLNDVAPISLMLFPVDLMRTEKSGLLMDAIFVLSLLSSQLRPSSVSVVFDFNTSLIDVAPASPISLSVDLIRIEKMNC